MNRRHALLALALSAVLAGPARAADENTVYLDTKDGRVTIELRPDIAPKHVKQLKTLINQGFYDGLKFHRVIDGFMAQTGDPNSANSQFFICLGDASFLNNQYTVVGLVTDGMSAVDGIKKGSRSDNGAVSNPDKIVKMQMAEKAK